MQFKGGLPPSKKFELAVPASLIAVWYITLLTLLYYPTICTRMLWTGGLVAGGHADYTNYPQPCDHQEPSYRRDAQ